MQKNIARRKYYNGSKLHVRQFAQNLTKISFANFFLELDIKSHHVLKISGGIVGQNQKCLL